MCLLIIIHKFRLNLIPLIHFTIHMRIPRLYFFLIFQGSDIPGIDEAVLEKAFSCLEQGERMVLGRAADGGYYCIGFRKEVFSKTGNGL